MFVIIGIVGVLVLLAVLFVLLQRHSDRTYRPSVAEIKTIIEKSIEGRLDLAAFDEFSCVRISYDKRLDSIRERYNAIVEDRAYIEGEITNRNCTPLNAAGKSQLKELLRELEGLQ